MSESEEVLTGSLSVLDVGQGNCQLLQDVSGPNIVFDCNLKSANEFVLGYLIGRGVETIDLLVLTGTDEDHADADGLKMLRNNFTIKRVWYPDFKKDSDNWRKVRRTLRSMEKDDGVVLETPEAGHDWRIGEFDLKVLSPHEDDSDTSNNASIVVKVSFGDVGLLFPGDCENERWENIVKYFGDDLPSEILLASHHGSTNGCYEPALEAISPRYTVISVGEDNQYGHPDDEAVKLYEEHTREKVFQTKDDKTILFEFDEENVTEYFVDAGDQGEAACDKPSQVTQAFRERRTTYVSPIGILSTNPSRGVGVPPTYDHGGRESSTVSKEDD